MIPTSCCVRVVTTETLAAGYGATTRQLINNFNRNKERFEDAYFRPVQIVRADPTAMGLPNFLDPVSSALARAEAKKESTRLSVELKEVKRTKSQISRKREASALGKLSAATRKNRELAERLGESTKQATITTVQNLTGKEYNPYPTLSAFFVVAFRSQNEATNL
ncbi:ORF6N domain-containing protein [Morganella morganii]